MSLIARTMDKIRLARTEALLDRGWLTYSWRLPPPTQPLYNEGTTDLTLLTGGIAIRGYRQALLIWDNLSVDQAALIRRIADDAIDNNGGILFATIDKGWSGKGARGSWMDVKGAVVIPRRRPLPNTRAILSEPFTLLINALEIVNDPAVF